MRTLTRRIFGALTGAAAGTWALSGPLAQAQARLRWFWWGNPERNKRTYEVVELYQQKNPGVVVDPETIGWDDYWPKMATQAAGKNLPDVLQMDYRYLFEYARRGQLEPLDDYLGGALDLSHFNPGFVDSGRVDGKLYAVPWTSNSVTTYYDMEKLAELGITMPDHRWTWDDLKEICREIKKSGGEGYAGVADKGHWEPMMELFMRQRGKALYTPEGELGYDETDVGDFFALWDGFRQEGLVPTADITAQDRTLQEMPLTIGRAAIDFAHSNQIVALQGLNQHELGMNMLPNTPGGQPGQYLKPSMLISVSQTSQAKEAAVAFMAFLAYDLDAAAILRVERGVPGDQRVAEHLAEGVNPDEKKMIDYLAVVTDNVGPLPPPPPTGAGEIEKMLLRMYPEMAFGRIDVKDGATQFYRQAQAILRRA
jgi:multiple sugar transport system substrate-binding protein